MLEHRSKLRYGYWFI